MPQPNKIPKAFAASGDRNIIPESTGTLGLASWNEGFPAITSVPFAEGGIAPKRADFNGIFNALSAAALWYQQGGVFVYDNATNYEIGNIVIYSGEIYVCKTANGPASALHSPANDTAETYWGRIYPQNGTFDRMFFSQTSGTYTAPRTGVYRITIKGGGGGGGGGKIGNTNVALVGAGGGEGAEMIFYDRLVKNTSYAYTIGAGGAAGTNASSNSDITQGSNGGATSISLNGTTFSVSGGGGGYKATTSQLGGAGGNTFTAAGTVYKIPGNPGEPGWTGAGGQGGNGGGSGGARSLTSATQHGIFGGGGMGAPFNASALAGDGGDGYILIEYAG